MNTLKDLFKQITSGLITSMMITTMVLIPFPSNMSMSYAADEATEVDESEVVEGEVDCEENVNEDGSAGVYKPGCDFNKALTKVNEDKYGGGTAGIIEQFIGAAFALAAMSSVQFTHTPRSIADCPQNRNADITLRIMQLGSLAYLIGELQAKNEYSKASKLATDNKFAVKEKKDVLAEDKKEAKKNKEENNKQLEAYGALMDIMDHQISALEKKKNMVMVAEASYLTAMGIELSMTMGHISMCESTRAALLTPKAKALGIITSAASAAVATGVCADVGAILGAFVTQESTCLSSNQASAEAEVVLSEAKSAEESGMLANVFNGLVSSFTLGLSAFFVSAPPIPKDGEIGKDTAKAAINTTVQAGCKTAEESVLTGMGAVCISQAAKTVVAAACMGGCTLALPEAGLVVAGDLVPIMCCGANTALAPNADHALPFPSEVHKKIDIFISPIAAIVDNSKHDFHKAVVMNTLYRTYFHIVNSNDKKGPQEKINQLASLDVMANYLDTNFDELIRNSQESQKLQELVQNMNDSNLKKILTSNMDSLKNSLLQDASANAFGDLLGFGVKLFAMQYFLGEHMRNTFLPKPLNRGATFLTMSVLNGAVLAFTGKAQKKAESRREIIQIEAQRFADSHALKSKIVGREDDGSKGKLNLKKGKMTPAQLGLAGFKTCAKPKKGGEFVPTLCPNIARRKHFAPPSFKTGGDTGMSPLFGQAAGLVTDVAFGAASGETYTDPAGMNESLTNLDNMRNALKKKNAYLIKKFDKYEKTLKGKKGAKRSASLSSSANVMRKLFSGGGGNSITPSQLDSVGRDLSKLNIEKLKDVNKANVGRAASVPSFKMPKAQKFDFDLGDSDIDSYDDGTSSKVAAKGEEDLSNFQVNNGEINENSDVNIFKLISNRYLRSYPILLEEVHTK
jgi:hypothetical protein